MLLTVSLRADQQFHSSGAASHQGLAAVFLSPAGCFDDCFSGSERRGCRVNIAHCLFLFATLTSLLANTPLLTSPHNVFAIFSVRLDSQWSICFHFSSFFHLFVVGRFLFQSELRVLSIGEQTLGLKMRKKRDNFRIFHLKKPQIWS